jgi:phosphoribosyl 1,2-cyclic phosphodiesterase
MSLYISSLNSGSNGNCYYIGNSREAVLVDAGISCRETEKRMKRNGLSMQKVKAIFISHEHSDHIRGVEVLSKKYNLPVYITSPTLQFSHLHIEQSLVRSFEAYKPVTIGELSITGFPKLHDASDPHSFVIDGSGVRIGVFTDIGSSCEHVIKNFSTCNAVFLEANYDEQMLMSGSYPFHLKKRISGNKGHLSNTQALELFLKHRSEFISHLFLAHLSRDNNSPELVHELFSKQAEKVFVQVASRYKETDVFAVKQNSASAGTAPVASPAPVNKQMTLF